MCRLGSVTYHKQIKHCIYLAKNSFTRTKYLLSMFLLRKACSSSLVFRLYNIPQAALHTQNSLTGIKYSLVTFALQKEIIIKFFYVQMRRTLTQTTDKHQPFILPLCSYCVPCRAKDIERKGAVWVSSGRIREVTEAIKGAGHGTPLWCFHVASVSLDYAKPDRFSHLPLIGGASLITSLS